MIWNFLFGALVFAVGAFIGAGIYNAGLHR